MKLAETIKKEELIDRLNFALDPDSMEWRDEYTLVVKGAIHMDNTRWEIGRGDYLKGAIIPSYLITDTSFVIEYAPFTVHVIAYEQPADLYKVDHYWDYIGRRYMEPLDPEDVEDPEDPEDAEDAYWDEQYEKLSDPTYWE